jgi:hypothetical protein
MAVRNRLLKVEVGSGEPTGAGLPALYLDADTGKFYHRGEGDAGWIVVAASAYAAVAAATTSSAAELNTLTGITASVDELNIMDGVGASAAEINAAADLSAFAVARTATALGDGTGLIAERGVIQYVTVTSDSADKIITLPAPTPGRIVILNVATTGFELRSSAPATVAINGGAEADAESAIAADSTCVMVCVSATAWKGFFLDADSDLAKVQAAAAA